MKKNGESEMSRIRIGGVLLLLLCGLAEAGVWQQEGADLARGAFVGTEVDSLQRLTLTSFRGVNLAFGAVAVSGENTLTGSRSVTDGDVNTEWRFNNQTEVLGKWIKIDLGGDRGVSRVRIRPGKTINLRPLFFLKGYRIEVAQEETPDDWILVAQQVESTQSMVDTIADSTWIETDGAGNPLPVLGRYVRLKIAREDPPNWVTIGEVEVFGEGYRASGHFESEAFDAGQPVNFGKAWFTGGEPAGTELRVQVRTSMDGETWEPWHRVEEWEMGDGNMEEWEMEEPEPAQFLQYRVSLETRHPLRTPWLERVEVQYDEVLFAASVLGQIEPQRPVLGEETVFTYVLEVEIGEGDLGFDRVWIGLPGEVEAVRVDGMILSEEEYEASWDGEGLEVVLASANRVVQSGRLEVDFAGVLLRPTLSVRASVGWGEALNFQNVRPAEEEGWTLVGKGVIGRTLPRDGIVVHPNPFNARRGAAQIRIDLAKVQVAQPVHVGIFDLSGRRVRTLWDGERMTAGRHPLEWDGRDDIDQLVVPGLYLLRVEVEADVGDVWMGTVGVVY